MLKPYVEFNKQKRIEAEKNRDKDRKALYKLMSNAIYRKTMKNLRNRVDVKLVNNKKNYSNCTSKPSYTPHKIFGYNLFAVCKVALRFNKPAYIGMCILELRKVLIYEEFHYGYIRNKYD